MRYLFGDYILDTQRAELHGAGAPIKLRRKVFQVLAYLLAHRDRVVPKHELLERLWPEQFVGDEVLKACITALRKALGEQGRSPWGGVTFVSGRLREGWCRNGHGWGDDRRLPEALPLLG
jgi:DNA-binding winged helix-turn-helix (wHTH) protein